MKRGLFFVLGVWLLLLPVNAGAATKPVFTVVDCPKNQGIVGFPAWFEGLKCVKSDKDDMLTPRISQASEIWVIVMNFAQWVIIGTGYIALYFIIYSGFKYITAAGGAQNIQSAKDTLRYAITGIVVALAAAAIVRTVQASVSGSIV